MRVLAISGSLRAVSSNTALLEAAVALVPPGMEIVLFRGLGDLPHFNPDLDGEGHTPHPTVAALRAQVSAAGGVIISSPEYAHGVPGAMKNALDWLVSHPEFAGKPVLLWNASAAGGQWAQGSLLETLNTMSARVLVEASLLDPFLVRKLRPGEELTDEDAVRAVKSSLAALAAWRPETRPADSRAHPLAVDARAAPPRARPTNYPEPFASRMARREKRPLGDLFGLKAFGVNLTRLSPGGESALHHRHTLQDEFVYVLAGEPTLVSDGEEGTLRSGACVGFPANGPAHHLENRTDRDVLFLEVGNRQAGDEVSYPNDDIQATMGDDGKWRIVHKDGTPY